ncbi:hypothetical protein CC78DRAFT_489804 [Lojkania enalia]|uniref:Ubiquitin 3 binding protein But2 C-terminal domain-containing protein n=1 Tax=Lojkania enalia TaxID=147567 RepID=A0A9P4KFQ7_9PLEO|nr:hypothetical protein CC78DRAFT_489804 [Didymosphaeria enalia]
MKFVILITLQLATALAAPSISPSNPLNELSFFRCPANSVQPNGNLPDDSIPTSLLVPISAKHPDEAYDATPWAKITPNDFCTIFNLELPVAATQGKLCSLVFDFPSFLQAPFLFRFAGPGHFSFTGFAINAGAVAGKTTFNNLPAPGPSPSNPPAVMMPGNSYIVNSAPCGIAGYIPGKVTVSGALCSKDTTLVFWQSDFICPLGFYVVLTDDPNM